MDDQTDFITDDRRMFTDSDTTIPEPTTTDELLREGWKEYLDNRLKGEL